MRTAPGSAPAVALTATLLFAACDGTRLSTESPVTTSPAAAAAGALAPSGPYSFSPAAFDIAAAPDGGILVAENSTIMEIRKHGVEEIGTVPTFPSPNVNGLAATGRGSFFATSAGLDLGEGAGVWHVSHGRAHLVGDVDAFESANDPDATGGPGWKNQACEEDPAQGYSAGPQSNPYHLTALSGGTALVADAAGNTLLRVTRDGTVDWVAVFTPPVDEFGDYRFLKTAESDASIECYVQPVPTSVAVGPDGAYYVGELTGAPGPGASGTGWSRIWRIDPGAHHAVCPSDTCEMVVDGLTAVIDLAFGPDGALYAVEYDHNGFLAAVVPSIPLAGGAIQRCDVDAGTCQTFATGLTLPSAITFDKWGHAWLLEGNITSPTVRRLD